MKNKLIYSILFALPVYFSCNQNPKATQKISSVDSVINKTCYISVDGKDTARMELTTVKSGKIMGNLSINYFGKDNNDGSVEGKFNGDTLFLDYTFKVGATNKTFFKNPLALLKTADKLTLGIGKMEHSMGRTYFVKNEPIDFDKGRFTFEPTPCKD